MFRRIRRGIVTALAMAVLLVPAARAQTDADKKNLQSAFERAYELQKQGKMAQAAHEYEQALDLARRTFPEERTTADMMHNLAILYRDMRRYTDAEPLFRRSLEIHEKQLGPDHPDVAQSLNNLAVLYRDIGRYADAEPLYRRSLEIWQKQLGRDHPNVAGSLINLANLYRAVGRYADAKPLYRRSLEIREKQLGRDHPDVATSLNDLASLYLDMGRYADAEPLYRRSLEIYETQLGPDHPNVAHSLNNLALLYLSLGRYADAEPLYRRSLEIREKQLGRDHPDIAGSLNNLANLYRTVGRYADAEPLYRRSLEIYEKQLGPDHPNVAHSLNNLALLYRTVGRYVDAEPLYRRSLEIYEKQLGPDHPVVGRCLHDLAAMYLDMGRNVDAEPLYRRSLEILEKQLGRDHPDVAGSLGGLANLYWFMGRYADAEPLYRRSLEIREKQLGREHPDVAGSLNNLANLVAALGRWDEAVDAVDRERHVVRRHVARELPALAEAEQLAFLKANDENNLHVALSVALARPGVAGAEERSAGWVLNGKAVAQEALAQRALLARDRGNPAAAPIVAQLTAVRHQLAALTLANPRAGQRVERLQEIDRLVAQERELSRQLGHAAGRPGRDDPWVTSDEVRRALPTDAVLVEIARFRVDNFQAKGSEEKWLPPHYAAWMIPPAGQGAVTLVDLGEAEAIEAAVAAVRNAIQPARVALRDRGEPEVEAELRKPLEALSERVLRPLLPQIGAAKRWVLSPDAALWLVPWAALPLDKHRYAIEDHTIGFVVSGRDLVQAGRKSPAGQGQALVMADPDYDLDPASARQAARQVLRGSTAAADELALRGLSRSFALGSIKRLPGTAAEAKAIEPKLQAYARAKPIVYTDRFALEAVFKAFRQPRVVLLSTHGFFLEDQKHEAGDKATLALEDRETGRKPRVTSENPLLRCGLLLAGCNHPQGDEDGVLTGLEIVGTDLRGTELVVLSACETGLGDVRNGEGVAGLRQAFQLSGVETVVATLWQIPDKESARLMAAFFDNLGAGQGKADALRAAQLDLMKSRRERYGAAHPFFWAAFTVTGAAR